MTTTEPRAAVGSRPFTGDEYLESLRDGREIWIYGQRVGDVTTHPAFRNSARSVARLYDALHDPEYKDVLTVPTDTGNGGFTHPFFRVPYSKDDLRASRDAIATWQRLTYGWLGRSPDYKGSFLGTLGADADFYAPYEENARRWYREAQERVLYLNHAIIHPPVDRNRPADEVGDVFVHVKEETDNGLVVSGAKVVATNSALTHYNFVAPVALPIQKPEFSVIFMAPMSAPGVKLLARASYELVAATTGSPFDYPLSSRLDENDAILIFDRALIPWENVFVYGDAEKAWRGFATHSGFRPRLSLQGLTRLAVKLDFIAGLTLRATELTGTSEFRGVQVSLGEIIALRHLLWGLTDGMIEGAIPWTGGAFLPNPDYGLAYRVLAPIVYGRVKEIIEHTVASGLIYVNSNAVDFKTPELRPYLDTYLRGSDGTPAVERVKLMKLLWDAIGSEFGGRHELYERNYAGNSDDTRLQTLAAAQRGGLADQLRGLVESCLSEYDLDGWTVPDMIDPGDVSAVGRI
jgi:4-hydroxyphenylacetate 3-monooxygenase